MARLRVVALAAWLLAALHAGSVIAQQEPCNLASFLNSSATVQAGALVTTRFSTDCSLSSGLAGAAEGQLPRVERDWWWSADQPRVLDAQWGSRRIAVLAGGHWRLVQGADC
jgi:hypothetical protein